MYVVNSKEKTPPYNNIIMDSLRIVHVACPYVCVILKFHCTCIHVYVILHVCACLYISCSCTYLYTVIIYNICIHSRMYCTVFNVAPPPPPPRMCMCPPPMLQHTLCSSAVISTRSHTFCNLALLMMLRCVHLYTCLFSGTPL